MAYNNNDDDDDDDNNNNNNNNNNTDEERLQPGAEQRSTYKGCMLNCSENIEFKRERSSYSIHSLIFSRWRDLRTGVV